MNDNTITLAIEAAVAGGSLALFRGRQRITSRPGDSDISRAEKLLPQIADMLTEAQTEKTALDQIAVSIGPGSFTGVRIGIATALGLKAALNIPCFGFSSLAAIAFGIDTPLIAAVPVGKSDVAWQEFGVDEYRPVSDDQDLFLEFVRRRPGTPLFVHSLLIARLGSALDESSVTSIGTDLASLIAEAVLSGVGSEDLSPIYLRNSRYTGVG